MLLVTTGFPIDSSLFEFNLIPIFFNCARKYAYIMKRSDINLVYDFHLAYVVHGTVIMKKKLDKSEYNCNRTSSIILHCRWIFHACDDYNKILTFLRACPIWNMDYGMVFIFKFHPLLCDIRRLGYMRSIWL